MKTWNGLGVNYKSLINYEDDAKYFKSINMGKVRLHVPFVNQPAEMALWKDAAEFWYGEGFYTIFGGSGSTETPAEWTTYAANIEAYAESLALVDQVADEFQIGNELELTVNGTTLTEATLRSNLRTLATTVKAIIPNYKISYSTSFFDDWSDWISEGKGDLDYLGINVYGNIIGTGPNWNRTYMESAKLQAMYDEFGADVRITEFNLDASNTNLQMFTTVKQNSYLREMQETLKDIGFAGAYAFQYRGIKDENDQFAFKKIDNTFVPYWDCLQNNNGRISLI